MGSRIGAPAKRYTRGMPRCRECAKGLEERETAVGRAPACPGCDHVHVEAERIENLRETAERRYTPADVRALRAEGQERKKAALERAVVYRRCPACGNQLLRRTYGELSFLLVHYCAAHGYWIHAGELAGMLDYVERGGEVLELQHAIEGHEEEHRKLKLDNRELERRAAAGGVVMVPFFS